MSEFSKKDNPGNAGSGIKNWRPMPSPTDEFGGLLHVESRDVDMVKLFGGTTYHQVVFTKDQMEAFARWFSVEGKPVDGVVEALDEHNLLRAVRDHGMRLMGFLAGRGLLEPNRDPVLSLGEMLTEYLEEPVVDYQEEDNG